MGRSPLIVKKEELQKIVSELEATRTFTNQQELFLAVSESEWGKNVRNANWRVKGIQPAVVYNKIRELGVTVKTPKGRKGRVAGQVVNRTARADKMKRKDIQKAVADVRKDINLYPGDNAKYMRIVDKVAEGSLKDAIKLKCMECRGYEGTDYKECKSTGCPLLPINLMFWPRNAEQKEGED